MQPADHPAVRPVAYRGKLNAGAIASGMNVAIRNARRLLADAELLQANGRFSSAAALAVLSIEESGKLTILRSMATAPDNDTLQKHWKSFRSHKAKNGHWIVGQLIADGARQLLDFRPAFEGGDHTDVLDAVKQIALYSDCFGTTPHWSEPDAVIERDFAASLIQQAKIVLPAREVAEREIELWIEHVGPHYGTTQMATGALAWFSAMKAEGLADIEPDQVARFMGDLLSKPAPNDVGEEPLPQADPPNAP